MKKIESPQDCCGCTACASICTHEAITLEADVLGFLYPKVEESKCVECGLCEKVCQFGENYDHSLNLPKPIAFVGRHKDINEVMKSRSGAAFVVISDYILERGGVVYGCGYKDHFRVAHKRAINKEERDEFRGSKYVQSDLTGVFKQVEADLKNGLTVLFSGTPCQTAGLNAYVGKKLREHLFLLDIACHGVPSPYVWRDYLAYLEKKHGAKICYVNFRDKEKYGWSAHKESFKFENGGGKFSFSYVFYQHIMFRKSCGNCHYTNLQRPSDITIADYWRWQRTDSKLNEDNKGVSLILCNTEKGKLLFEVVKEKMDIVPADLENVIQTAFLHPHEQSPYRDAFEKDYAVHGFEHSMRKFGMMGWKYQLILFRKGIRRYKSRLVKKLKLKK